MPINGCLVLLDKCLAGCLEIKTVLCLVSLTARSELGLKYTALCVSMRLDLSGIVCKQISHRADGAECTCVQSAVRLA